MNKLTEIKERIETCRTDLDDILNIAIRELIDEVQELRDYISRRDNLPAWPVAKPPVGGWPKDTAEPNGKLTDQRGERM
jgi:hypothetical protein